MNPILSIAVFFMAVAVLAKSGSVIVRRMSRIARFFQVSEFAASFVLIALATSLPDFFVGISSALHGKPELSFANIVGANIATLTIAAGIVVVIGGGLAVRKGTARKDALYASFAAFLPVMLFLDGALSRVDGILLIGFALWYFVTVLYQRERFTKIFLNHNNHLFNPKRFFRDSAVLLAALAVLIASAEILTRSTLSVASGFGISIPVIGILLVALSITLPEIVFGIRAVMMKHKGLVLGNLIGSVVVNSGFIIGITALIAPIRVHSFIPYNVGITFTIIVVIMFALFTHTGRKISVREGILLIGTYVLFVLFLFLLDGRVA